MLFSVAENVLIAKNTWRIKLLGDTSKLQHPGQFVQCKIPEFYLRRPLSVCDWDSESLTLIYKVIGQGTQAMTQMQPNEPMDLLTGLGNGFSIVPGHPILVGGGVGVPPLLKLCKDLLQNGIEPAVVLGFNTQDEIFLADEFSSLGAKVTVTTADGSFGIKGFVTHGMQTLPADYNYVYTCGPEPMLKAVFQLCNKRGISGQFSLEERMACGFGACMGCSIQVRSGAKRVCVDGPVFSKEELLW